MTRPIANIADVELRAFPGEIPEPARARFEGARLGDIGSMLGSKKLGYNVTVLPPGKSAFPFHSHGVNEEMFFVLEGEGEVRIGSETHSIRAGDVIACPPGGPETAHQIANSGDAELRFLAVSTKLSPEIVAYPDSGKFGVLGDGFRFLGRAEESLGYWDDES
jgi:uncharacterized cupin superfamily protein